MSLINKSITFTQHVAALASLEGDNDLVRLAAALLVAHYDGRLPASFYLPLTDNERNNEDGAKWIEMLRQRVCLHEAGIIERAVALDAFIGVHPNGFH